jgi:hypothetical protein
MIQRFQDIGLELIFEPAGQQNPYLERFFREIEFRPDTRGDQRVHTLCMKFDDQLVFLFEHHGHEIPLISQTGRLHHR